MTQHRYALLSAISVEEDRQRKAHPLEAHNELVDSIKSRGLLMAPVLRQVGDTLTLVAGERRLRAISDIYDLGGSFCYDGLAVPEGHVPYTLLSDLDPLAAQEAELDENLRRVDLTWQERAAAIAKLEGLRRRQAAANGAPMPTADHITRELLGDFTSSNSELGATYVAQKNEVLVARHLDKPEVRGAKTVAEAMKVLTRMEQKSRREDLAEKVGETFNAGMHKLHNRDARELLPLMGESLFDVILSDPPYGMGADTFGDSSGAGGVQGEHFYKDDYPSWQQLMWDLIPQTFRLAKPQAHLYLFCDIDRFHELRTMCQDTGWKVFRTPLIFHKPSASRAPWPDQGPQRKYECIMFAVKGDKPVTKLYGDVLTHSPDPQMDHPAQKPVALFVDLLRRSVGPGDTVLDFCAGSGPIFPAAHELQCVATGVEMSPAAFGMCMERQEKLK